MPINKSLRSSNSRLSDQLGIWRFLNYQVVWVFVMYSSSPHTNMLKDWIWEAATASNIVFRLRFPFVGPRSAVCRVTLTCKRASSLPGVCNWRVNLQSGLKNSRWFPTPQIVLHFCQYILSWMTTNYPTAQHSAQSTLTVTCIADMIDNNDDSRIGLES